jgi:glycosyltransferase involved in cell wall biosynthesis
MVAEVGQAGIRTWVAAAGRLRDLRAFGRTVRGLRRHIERERPHVVLSWGSKPQLYAGPASVGQPGLINAWWMLEIPKREWLPCLATLLPARAIACSSHYVAREQTRLLRPRRPCCVIHPGVTSPRPVAPAEVDDLRATLGVPSSRIVIGSVGRMQPWKNHHLVVEAIGRLLREGRDVHGVVVGATAHGRSPNYEDGLRRYVEHAGLSDRISLVGHQQDIDLYFALFDLFVLGSADEPFGLVVLEAMAAGVPAIAVDCAGPAEILDHDRTGTLVHHATAENFAIAIARLVDEPDDRARMAAAARDEYERRFTVGRMVAEFEATLTRLVADQAGVEA